MTLQQIVAKYVKEHMVSNALAEHYYGDGGGGMMEQQRQMMSRLDNNAQLVSFFVVYVIVYLLIMLFGTWIWNNFVVDMFSIVRPIPSVWHLIALSILVKLVIY